MSVILEIKNRTNLNHSFCLTDYDIDCGLNAAGGMNDECMEFWWDKVQQCSQEFQERDDGLIFVSPSAMHLVNILKGDDELHCSFSNLALQRKGLIMMPVNDYKGINTSGGTHWALLCYIRQENEFRFFDSFADHNKAMAQCAATRLAPIIGANGGEPRTHLFGCHLPALNGSNLSPPLPPHPRS